MGVNTARKSQFPPVYGSDWSHHPARKCLFGITQNVLKIFKTRQDSRAGVNIITMPEKATTRGIDEINRSTVPQEVLF